MSRQSLQQLFDEHAGEPVEARLVDVAALESVFEDFRDQPVRFLELGVRDATSLEVWSRYFPHAKVLVGCDPDAALGVQFADDVRVEMIIGDISSSGIHEEISLRLANADIVIDNEIQKSAQFIRSFVLRFLHLAPGGVYVAQSVCSAKDPDEVLHPHGALSFFNRLSEVVKQVPRNEPDARAKILSEMLLEFGCEISPLVLSEIHSVDVISSSYVIRKAQFGANATLGHEASSDAAIDNSIEHPARPIRPGTPSSRVTSARVARSIAPVELDPHIEDQIEELKLQIGELSREVIERGEEVDLYRHSTTWQLTAPMRFAVHNAKILIRRIGRRKNEPASTATDEQAEPANAGGLRVMLVQRGRVFYFRHMKGTRLGRAIGRLVLKTGLVSRPELDMAALSLDSIAANKTQYTDPGHVEADSSVPGFHLSPPLNFVIADRLSLKPRINVLIPSLRLKHMSGGPNTALLLASLLAEQGEQLRLIACDAATEGEEAALYPHMDKLLGRAVARDSFELVDGTDRTQPVFIGINDIFLATAWWTAQIAKYGVEKTTHKTFIYLIQDFEPILHEGSTFQARALETYGLPHIPVINTRLLLDHMVAQKAGCFAEKAFSDTALWFEPALDRSFYFPDPGQASPSRKKVLLFYARPTVARRNLFELGVVALRQAVASGVIDNDNWEVWAMGEQLAPVALGNDVFLNPLPWKDFAAYAERVRTADLLLSLMLSPHPSYPPLEMAASGKMVVTNSFSVKTAERMQSLSPNIIVAAPNAHDVAVALKGAARRINANLSSPDPSGAIDLPSDWNESLRDVVQTLLVRIDALRSTPPDACVPTIAGFPAEPKSGYELYRRESLARRRQDGPYKQVPGLLSFVTSAFNTKPIYLEELGNSILHQDGGMQFEWLILDNGSTSKYTRHALQELALNPGVRLERVEKNLGIIGGMRFCLENARGRYILPLDSDDIVEPDTVNVLSRFIIENNYPPLLYTDEDKLNAGRFLSPYFKPDWDPVLLLHSCYIAHLCAINREIGLRLDLYTDQSAEGCHDWDSFIRFMNEGVFPSHVPEILYSWRMHNQSTSGNIESKSYIEQSHRKTLQRYLDRSNAPNLELVHSPLFDFNVDWWYRRKRDVPVSCFSVTISSVNNGQTHVHATNSRAQVSADLDNGMSELAQLTSECSADLIHLNWVGVTPDNDEWRWDAAGLMELFDDAVLVGGALHDGNKVVGGPITFGFGNGIECPDSGRLLVDFGYSAFMFKPHSVSAVSSGHCVVRREFLLDVMPELLSKGVELCTLGPWLGAMAARVHKRVLFSPFMRAKAVAVPEASMSEHAHAHFLSSFWTQIPESRFYSKHLGLTRDTAYEPVTGFERDIHIRKLQLRTLPYGKWFEQELRSRAENYPVTEKSVKLSVVTPVYAGSDLQLLAELATCICEQTVPAYEWLLVVNGPMSTESMSQIAEEASSEWNASVVVEPEAVGIAASLRMGLEQAEGDYVIVVDADDLMTLDALQIVSFEILRGEQPALLFSDEDMLVDGQPVSPYLRGPYDRVLALENSTIWHLCAMRRDVALEMDVFGDSRADWCQDWDTLSRLASFTDNIVHIPEVLYHWRQHSGSTTNNSKGDARSLDSVRYVLERHIARTDMPQRFFVAEWPENRGSTELYIARRPDDLPQMVLLADDLSAHDLTCDDDAVLLVLGDEVLIDSQAVFVEVVRLLDLHPQVGAVGGLIEDMNGIVVDGCQLSNVNDCLESPWVGQHVNYAGPFSLHAKPQSVTTTGNCMAMFRVSALKDVGLWPPESRERLSMQIQQMCGRLSEGGWTVAFSPLVRARTGSSFRAEQPGVRVPKGCSTVCHGLVRYGSTRPYRD